MPWLLGGNPGSNAAARQLVDLVYADRASLEVFLTEQQRDTETAYRALEHSCRAK